MTLCVYFDGFKLRFTTSKSLNIKLKATHAFEVDPEQFKTAECRKESESLCMGILQQHGILSNAARRERFGFKALVRLFCKTGAAALPRIEIRMEGPFLSEFLGHQSPLKVAGLRLELLEMDGALIDMKKGGFKETLQNNYWCVSQDLRSNVFGNGGLEGNKDHEAILQIWLKPTVFASP